MVTINRETGRLKERRSNRYFRPFTEVTVQGISHSFISPAGWMGWLANHRLVVENEASIRSHAVRALLE